MSYPWFCKPNEYAEEVDTSSTHPFTHASVFTLIPGGQYVANLRDHIDGCDPFVVDKVVTLRHRFVGVDLKLVRILLCSFGEFLQVESFVGTFAPTDSHGGPAVEMANRPDAILFEDIVDVYWRWVAGVGHTMVADENNVDDVREIP